MYEYLSQDVSISNKSKLASISNVQGQIHVGSKYQAKLPECTNKKPTESCSDYEKICWVPDAISDNDIIVFLQTARSMTTLVGFDADRKQVISQDTITINALNHLHDCHYDKNTALQSLIKKRKQFNTEVTFTEDDAKFFITSLHQFGKNFFRMHKEYLQNKQVSELVEYYYLWKRINKAAKIQDSLSKIETNVNNWNTLSLSTFKNSRNSIPNNNDDNNNGNVTNAPLSQYDEMCEKKNIDCKKELDSDKNLYQVRPILAVPPVKHQISPPPLISTSSRNEVKNIFDKHVPLVIHEHGPPPPLKKLIVNSLESKAISEMSSQCETSNGNNMSPVSIPDKDPDIINKIEREWPNCIIIRHLDRGNNTCSRTDLIFSIHPSSKFSKSKSNSRNGTNKTHSKDEKTRKTNDSNSLSNIHKLTNNSTCNNNNKQQTLLNSDTPALQQLRAYSDRANLHPMPPLNLSNGIQPNQQRIDNDIPHKNHDRSVRRHEIHDREIHDSDVQEKVNNPYEAQYLQMQREYSMRGIPFPQSSGYLPFNNFPSHLSGVSGVYPPINITQRDQERLLVERIQAERSAAFNDPLLSRLYMQHQFVPPSTQSFPMPGAAGYMHPVFERDATAAAAIQRQLFIQQMQQDYFQNINHFMPH